MFATLYAAIKAQYANNYAFTRIASDLYWEWNEVEENIRFQKLSAGNDIVALDLYKNLVTFKF